MSNLLKILRTNPFPKFHIDLAGKVSLFEKERRVPVGITYEEICAIIPKEQRRKYQLDDGITITTGRNRCGNSIALMDLLESAPTGPYKFYKHTSDYVYRCYSGRMIHISSKCAAVLFNRQNGLSVEREDIVNYIVKKNYGIEFDS